MDFDNDSWKMGTKIPFFLGATKNQPLMFKSRALANPCLYRM